MNESFVPEYAVQNTDTISGFFGDYRFLSNFFPSIVEYKGLRFPSVEAAYQSAKTTEPERFVNLTPSESKKLGKKLPLKKDWDVHKYGIMFYLVFQKFSTDKDLREKLLTTKNAQLVEANSWNDTYWGVAYELKEGVWVKKGGTNRLGTILSTVRGCLE